MKMIKVASAILTAGILATASPAAAIPPHVPGRVLVKTRDGSAPQSFVSAHASLGLERASALFPKEQSGNAHGRSQASNAALARWMVVELHDPQGDVDAIVAKLRALPDVEWAEPDYVAQILADSPATQTIRPQLHPQTNLSVDDPRFGDQWALTYVHAPGAWDISQGSSSQIIAVIDTGIDLDHPDLASKIYVNPRELVGDANGDNCPGICGVDDDGDGLVDEGNKNDDDENGYVDDIKGWNFVANSSNAQDDNGHGTHAAGIAAAATNNGIGIAGACPLCMLMPLKAFDSTGSGASSNIASAITYAWRNGATVISMSFEQTTDAQVMRDALFAAYNGDARSPGVVLVAAAGNRRSSKSTAFCTAAATDLPISPSYPAAYPYVIGVEANDNAGVIASFSNCQYTVRDPGVSIVSTYWNDTYLSMSGTSMACPLVAGIAGLVRAHNPTWTPGQVFTQIQQASGDALQALTLGPQPRMQFVSYRLVDDCPACNNDGLIQPGETIKIIATVHNAGSSALGVNGTLTTSDPAATIVTGSTTWGGVGPNNDDDDADNPLQVTISSGATHNQTISLSLAGTVSNGDGSSGFTEPITLLVTRAITKSGVISADETWIASNLYVVTSDLLLDTNVTLTIEPGTHVLVNPNASIFIRGPLIVRGTPSQHIFFGVNSTTPGAKWGGFAIQFNSAAGSATFDADGNYISGPTFQYCEFSNGGSGRPVIEGGNSGPVGYIARNIFVDNNAALNIATTGPAHIEYNLFNRNAASPIINVYYAPNRFQHNTIVGNVGAYAFVVPYASTQTGVRYNNWFETHPSASGGSSLDIWVPNFNPVDITNNYWGTTDSTAIAARVHDFFDDFSLGRATYIPLLTDPDPSAPPVVAQISTSPVSPIGAERVTFTVTFSKAMDPAISPILTFGPQFPYSTIRPTINPHWIDSTHWSVDYNVNKTTGDGNQRVTVSGGRDLSGFPLPTGDYRFGFEIRTSGTSSASLTANGRAGGVDLTWTAADPAVYPTLAGYNVYRGSSSTGPFTKLNGALVGDITYSDTTAAPGVLYYYVYRIVDSDNAESGNSDVASAAALDNVPPVITHTAVTSAPAGQILTIQATMTDNIAVTAGRLFYRPLGSANSYTQLNMINATGSTWSVNIPATDMVAPGIEYYLEASDGVTTVQHGTPAAPHQVTVVDRPSITSLDVTHGPLTGNTLVTLTGTNFQNGATVTFGGIAATNVVVNSSNSITCRTGAHYPQVVDVKVTNPNAANGTLIRAYTYDGSQTTLQLPTMSGDRMSTIAVGITTPGVEGAISATFEFTYDSSKLTLQSVSTGTLNSGWSVVSNTSTAGTVRVSLAGTSAVTGAGTLASVSFQVTSNPGTSSALTWSQATLNDGTIPITQSNGQVTVNNSFQVTGSVSYYNAARAVSGATMTLAGANSYSQSTAADGSYSIANVPSDNYVLSAAKSDGVISGSISALDASYVLQHDAHLITLTSAQQTAADVNGSGTVNAQDATAILQYVAGLTTLPFEGAGKVWSFSPATRLYSPLLTNQSAQTFTATLLGDPTGNWNAGGAGLMAPAIESAGSVGLSLANIVTCGASATLPLNVTSIDSPLHAIELRVNYDASKMSVAAVRADTLANGWILAANLNQPGVIRIAMAGAAPITTTGTLLQIDLTNIVAPGGAMTVSSPMLDEGQIAVSAISGGVTTCPAGDVNGDGVASINDIFVLIDRAYGSGSPTAGNADINHDAVVNAQDVDVLVSWKYAAGPAPLP